MLSLPFNLLLFLGLWFLAILPLRKYLRPDDAQLLFVIGAAGILAAVSAFFYVVPREPFEMTTMDYVMRDVKVFGASAITMFATSGALYDIARHHHDDENPE